jgi:hypothetical protein
LKEHVYVYSQRKKSLHIYTYVLGGQWYPQPTRVQVLVLTFILDLFQNFRRCAFSGRRRSRRLRGAYGNFVKSQDDMPAQSFEGAHRGRVCVCAFIGVSVCAYIYERLRLYCVKKKTCMHMDSTSTYRSSVPLTRLPGPTQVHDSDHWRADFRTPLTPAPRTTIPVTPNEPAASCRLYDYG